MKRWKKWTLGIAGTLVAPIVIMTAVFWPSIQILRGTEGISGDTEAIPEVAETELPPLTEGEADWICWRGASLNGTSTVTGIVKDWSAGLRKLWEVNYLCNGRSAATWSAPVVKGNRLVVPGRDKDSDIVFCLNPETGDIIWRSSYEAKAKSSHGTGPRATPYIDGEFVYTFGRSGVLVCWKLLDGAQVWRRNVADIGAKEPTWGLSSSPLVVGKLVIVQAGGTAGTVAYDKTSGDVVWKAGSEHAGYAALMTMRIGDIDALLVFHGKGLEALALDGGRRLWNHPWETDYDVNATTPVVDAQRVFITSDYGRGGTLLAITDSAAKVVWKSTAIASHHSDPFVINGHIYGYSGLSAQNRGDFKCVDLETGEQKWSTGEIGWGTCVRVDGHLLCCDIKGNIFLVKPDPSGLSIVTRMPLALGDVKGPVWTIPVLANGRLYLRFKQKLVCYEIAGERTP